MKVGFAKDGRITALDMFVISNNGPYDADGRWRDIGPHCVAAVPAAGDALARRDGDDEHAAAQRAERAGRHAGHRDHRADSREGGAQARARPGGDSPHQLPGGQGAVRTAGAGQAAARDKRFLKEALDRGAEQFKWSERVARIPSGVGTKVRGVGVSLSCYVGGTIGFDGLLVITPDGRVQFQSGIGNLGTESVIDVHRAGAEVLGVPWEKCDVVWGDTSKNLPYTCVSGGSQTTHAMTRAALRGGHGCEEETAGNRGEESGRQAGGLRSGQRARVPQGRRRGHDSGAGRRSARFNWAASTTATKCRQT